MRPNPKQEQFLRATTRYVAYGGARGGGKSWAVRVKAVLLAINYPGIRIMIMRRSYPELKENHVNTLIKLTFGMAEYSEVNKTLTFSNRSRIRFGYCDNESDVSRYQGMEFDVLFIDEATQFTEFQFETLNSIVRGVNDFPKRTYLTCNPGGVGHTWVKRLFIDKKYKDTENPSNYTFIPATVFDNQALMSQDPDYVKTLENLSDTLKRAWLYGDWDITSGRYFSEFSEKIHVVDDYDVNNFTKIYAALDYGLDCFCNLYFGIERSGKIVLFDEIWQKDVIISKACEISRNKPFKPYIQLAPPDIWGRSQESGKSRADIFFENGLYLTKTGNDVKAGLLNVKELLKIAKDGEPTLKIAKNCTNVIYSLSNIMTDVNDPDVNSNTPHYLTHAVDALRYFASHYFSPHKQTYVFDISTLRDDIRADYLNGTEEERRLIERRYKR